MVCIFLTGNKASMMLFTINSVLTLILGQTGHIENSVGPIQMPQNTGSNQALHCLPLDPGVVFFRYMYITDLFIFFTSMVSS